MVLWTVYPSTRRWIPTPRNYEDMAVRKGLYEVLGALASDAAPAVPALRAGLKEKSSEYCFDAIQALGRIGPAAKDAVPDLLPFLDSNQPQVQRAAAMALEEIGFSNLKTSRLLYEARAATNQAFKRVTKPWP